MSPLATLPEPRYVPLGSPDESACKPIVTASAGEPIFERLTVISVTVPLSGKVTLSAYFSL